MRTNDFLPTSRTHQRGILAMVLHLLVVLSHVLNKAAHIAVHALGGIGGQHTATRAAPVAGMAGGVDFEELEAGAELADTVLAAFRASDYSCRFTVFGGKRRVNW
jgi:hypothetical protein